MTDAWEYDAVGAPSAFPWPPEEGASLLGAFGETWRSAALEPASFFRRIPRTGGTGAAVLYYLAIGILVAGASLFWDTIRGPGGAGDEVLGEMGAAASPLVSFLLSPIMLLIGLGLVAGVVHLMLLLVKGAAHGMDTTVRTLCYAYSPMILGVIPWLGPLVGTLWMLVLAVVGLREAHETVTWKSAVAVVVPFVILMGLALMAIAAVTADALLGS